MISAIGLALQTFGSMSVLSQIKMTRTRDNNKCTKQAFYTQTLTRYLTGQ